LGQSDVFLEFQERITKAAPIDRPVLTIGKGGMGQKHTSFMVFEFLD